MTSCCQTQVLTSSRLFDKKNPDQLRVPIAEPWSFKRRLNASRWFDEEIVAGGLITQGKAQSLKSMMTGWALVELVKRAGTRRFRVSSASR